MVRVEHLEKRFKKKQVLKGIDFSFEEKVYGLLGPNGAGKTTLMRCMTNLYDCSAGAVTYEGDPIAKSKVYFREMGYLPQKFGVFHDLTVWDIMRYFAYEKGMKKGEMKAAIEKSLKTINLADCARQRADTLSGGMLRRLGIAQAILNDPKIVILDEPTTGLDPEERMRFKSIISEIRHSRTIIISTHIVEDIEAVCDEILVMGEGKILTAGTSVDIRNLAAGKVYEIPVQDEQKLMGDYHIQRRYEKEDGAYLRVLSGTEQPGAVPLEPSVEDGYVCCLRNI